ncbi:MAG: hypothetical protein K2X66_06135, partial [Cyanobacteria bacterium]|nr:hypothetical protein [Cyanobacteriota bacterium]
MTIRFSGITFYQGQEPHVKKTLETLEKNFGVTTAFVNGQGVVLDGKDSYDFIKQKYDIDIPEEFKKSSTEEVVQILS